MADDITPPEQAANPPDLMGYPSVEALVQAKRAGDAEAKRLHEENQRYASQMAATQRPAIEFRNPDPYSELETIGVPTSHLRAAIQQEAAKFFEPVVQQIRGQANARSSMVSTYGNDYVQFEQEVAQHVQANPELQAQYSAIFNSHPEQGPVAAAKFAFLDFAETKRRSAPEPQDTRPDQARAAVPTSKGGEGKTRTSDSAQERVNRAWDAWQKNPNRHTAEQYARARFKTAVSDEFLES